jgi:phage tail-like protein
MLIQNMKSGTITTITAVVTRLIIEVSDSTGFTDGTSVQVQANTFDGDSLVKYLPSFYANDFLAEFLHVFAQEIQRQWSKIIQIPPIGDPNTCPENLLPILANSYGAPVDADDEDVVKRTFIKVIQYGFKNKGSRKGIEAAFRSLGYDVVIKEYFFGKYIGTVGSVSGDVVTLHSGFQIPTTNGAFKVDDLISVSTGSGSRVPVSSPGQWRFIKSVNNSHEYRVYGGNGSMFSPGQNLVVFAYNEQRVAVNSDFNDIEANEFPLTSSFIKAFIRDRRPVPIDITDKILGKLKYYLGIFKSSHARLRGAGIQTELIGLASFRSNTDTVDRGPIMTITVPWAAEIMYGTIESFAPYLDDGENLDTYLSLDSVPFLTQSITFNFGNTSRSSSESTSLGESWSVVTV